MTPKHVCRVPHVFLKLTLGNLTIDMNPYCTDLFVILEF
jgi:hypothetical protein